MTRSATQTLADDRGVEAGQATPFRSGRQRRLRCSVVGGSDAGYGHLRTTRGRAQFDTYAYVQLGYVILFTLQETYTIATLTKKK